MTLEDNLRLAVENLDSQVTEIEAEISSLTGWQRQVVEEFNSHIADLSRGRDLHVAAIEQMIERLHTRLNMLKKPVIS